MFTFHTIIFNDLKFHRKKQYQTVALPYLDSDTVYYRQLHPNLYILPSVGDNTDKQNKKVWLCIDFQWRTEIVKNPNVHSKGPA